MPEAPEYFDNVTVGQYAMTGVPLKVYVNGEYLIITDPDDIENPLIGFGMLPNGEMEQFDYKQIEHLLVSGNVVDLETYKKAMEDDNKEEEGEEEEGEEEEGEEEKEEEGEEEKEEKEENPFESVKPIPSLLSLVEGPATEKAQKVIDKLKAKLIKAKEDKLEAEKEELGEEVINEADYETTMRRKYGANKDYTNIDVKDIHFQTNPKEFEAMMSALGKRFGARTAREEIADAEYELKRFRKSIKYGDGKSLDPFVPGTYEAATSKLGDGPHAKARPKVTWNDKKYKEWIDSVAADGGADHAFDMAQNATQEQGLIAWVKKNRTYDEEPLERIQWDIEAMAESVNEAKEISRSKIDIMGSKILGKIKIGTTFVTDGGDYTVTGFGPKSNAFQEFDAEKDGKPCKVKLSVMYGVKLEVTDDPRSRVYRKEEMLNSMIFESVNEMKMVHKGKDITKHVLAYMEKKITKAEFEKLTGLKKEKLKVNENTDAYALHRLADNVGQSVAEEFLMNHNVDLKLLAKAVQQKTINKYEVRDVINNTAHKFKIKQFMDEFVKESVNESVIGDILIIADENNTYEAFTAELVSQKYLMPDELEDPETKQWLEDTYANVHESISLAKIVKEARKPRGYWEKKYKHLQKKPKYKKGDEVIYVQGIGGPDELSPETSRVKKVSKGLAGFKYDLTNYIQTNDSEILGLAESVNEAKDFKKGNKVSYKDDEGKTKSGYIIKKMTRTFRGKKSIQYLIGKTKNTDSKLGRFDTISTAAGKTPKNMWLREDYMEGPPYEYDNISEPYSIKVGDFVKNTNPSCPHHGSQGMVKNVISMPNDIGDLIKYVVMNQGDTYRAGDVLTKTPDQLEVIKY